MSSQLDWQWVYSEQDPDIYIIDLDNYSSETFAQNKIHIALSNHPVQLAAYQYVLKRPLRFQELLKVLKDIEDHESAPLQLEQKILFPTQITHNHQTVDHIEYKLVCFPDFANISNDVISNTARVCALLSMRASTIQYIVNFLDISTVEVKQILKFINDAAHSNHPVLIKEICDGQTAINNNIENRASTHKTSSFFSKIWKKLKGEL